MNDIKFEYQGRYIRLYEPTKLAEEWITGMGPLTAACNSKSIAHAFESGLPDKRFYEEWDHETDPEWCTIQRIHYSQLPQRPAFWKDLLEEEEYQKVIGLMAEVKTVPSDSTKKNNRLQILILTTESLPLSAIQMVEWYAMRKEDSDLEERKLVAVREYLINYQIALMKFSQQNPAIDMEKVIQTLLSD